MIYLAGPFFNKRQVAYAESLAAHVKSRGHECFAPVSGLWQEDKGLLKAKEIFDRNVEQLKKASIVLAQLDYPLDPGVKCYVEPLHGARILMNLPDAGTVWEMGWAHANGIPIVGYYIKKPKRVNLMLSFACKGVTHDIFRFVQPTGLFNWDVVEEWKGEMI